MIGHVIRTQGEDIHHVLLVGGTAFIPSLQQTLDGYFRAITERHKKIFDMPEWPSLTWSVDNTTIRVDKPFTAVVEEALQVSAGFGLDDQLGHGYGCGAHVGGLGLINSPGRWGRAGVGTGVAGGES